MTQKFFRAFTLAAIAFVGFSAKAEIIQTSSVIKQSEARLLDFVPKVEPVPTSVELKVNPTRVKYVREFTLSEIDAYSVNNNTGDLINNLKAAVVYDASCDYDCDLIVGARFKIELSSKKGATVEMYGYAATFVNWGVKYNSTETSKGTDDKVKNNQ